jgi:hypothetical protein
MKTTMNTHALKFLAASLSLLAATANNAFAQPPSSPLLANPVIVVSDVQIALQGDPFATYVLQGSTDLTSTNWTIISTHRANGTGALVFTDTNAVTLFTNRFYRALAEN